MVERPEPFRRATASRDASSSKQTDGGPAVEGLTRAQAKAHSRCAPLTPEEFRARRRVAEQGLVSLREVLNADADRRSGVDAGRG